MRGGSSNMEDINPADYGFTGHSYAYDPCPPAEKLTDEVFHSMTETAKETWSNTTRWIKRNECLEKTLKWDNLDPNAKKEEILRQWHALPQTSRDCLTKALPEERDFIHKFVNLNDTSKVNKWENLPISTKQFLIGILKDARNKIELRKNVLKQQWETDPTSYPSYATDKITADTALNKAKREYDAAETEYKRCVDLEEKETDAYVNKKSKAGFFSSFNTKLKKEENEVNHTINNTVRSKTIMDAAKKKLEELQAKCDTFDATYQLPDESAVDDTLRSTIDSEKYIEKAIAEVEFLLGTTLGEKYLNELSLWLKKSTEEKMQIINGDYRPNK
jgi:hypothetical protein